MGSFSLNIGVTIDAVDMNYNYRVMNTMNRHSNSPNLSDEEEEGGEGEEEESSEESSPASVEVGDDSPQISLIKQGLNISSSMNGSDVRVGIIMARWNADVIQGLYKVGTLTYLYVSLFIYP